MIVQMCYSIHCPNCNSETLAMDYSDCVDYCLREHYRCMNCGAGFGVEYEMDL